MASCAEVNVALKASARQMILLIPVSLSQLVTSIGSGLVSPVLVVVESAELLLLVPESLPHDIMIELRAKARQKCFIVTFIW